MVARLCGGRPGGRGEEPLEGAVGAGVLALRLGLRVIKGLERGAAEELLAQRARAGPFADMDELVARCPTSPPLLLRLALAGPWTGCFPRPPARAGGVPRPSGPRIVTGSRARGCSTPPPGRQKAPSSPA